MVAFSPTAYSTLGVPATALPSARTLQASEDGQIVVTTRAAIYILTPALGLRLDDLRAHKGNASSRAPVGHALDLRWFRSHIELVKADINWGAHTEASWSSNVFGSLDPAWRSVTISPSGVSASAGCVLATLTTNLEVGLWAPNKNYVEGAWEQKFNVTSLLLEHFGTTEDSPTNGLLQAQIECMAWSTQPRHGQYTPLVSAQSLLALGSRAGSIAFLRYDESPSTTTVIHAMGVGDDRLTSLAWSSWCRGADDSHQAILACALPSGSISLVRVRQRYNTSSDELEVTSEIIESELDLLPASADDAGITALEWITLRSGAPVLVHCKPGVISLFCPPEEVLPGRGSTAIADGARWEGSRALTVQSQRLSAGSSCWTPASGVSYVAESDVLIVTLFDGSMHAIHEVTVSPTLEAPPHPATLTTSALSKTARRLFVQHEEHALSRQITAQDVNRTTGMIDFAVNGHMLSIFEATRPNYFDYQSDAHQRSEIVVSQAWEPDHPVDAIIDVVARILSDPEADMHVPPAHLLRSVFFHLRMPETSEILQGRLLALLEATTLPEYTLPSAVQLNAERELVVQTHSNLRNSVETHARLRVLNVHYALADACLALKNASDPLAEQWRTAVHTIEIDITRTRIAILVENLRAIAAEIATPEHATFLARVAEQAKALECPSHIQASASLLAQNCGIPSAADVNSIHDVCPACAAPIAADDTSHNLRCARGHIWTRCTVTSFILATPHVQTCAGCNRKALLAPTQLHDASTPITAYSWLPQSARTWVVGAILEATRRCPLCGNRFVVLL